MPQNTLQNSLIWTEEHDIFCLRHSIPPAAQYLWRWLMRQGLVGKEIEPDLSEFNLYVKSNRGKGFDQPYLVEMFELLQSHQVIRVTKQFSWKVYRLIVRLLSSLDPPKKKPRKNSNSFDFIPETEPSNAQSTEEVLNNSSNSSTHITTEEFEELDRRHEILKTCLDQGIYFDPHKTTTEELFLYDIETIKFALECFLKAGGHNLDARGNPIIRHPQGWLISCLRGEYWYESKISLVDALLALKSFFPSNLPRDFQ